MASWTNSKLIQLTRNKIHVNAKFVLLKFGSGAGCFNNAGKG
jgi:hypothetical protein